MEEVTGEKKTRLKLAKIPRGKWKKEVAVEEEDLQSPTNRPSLPLFLPRASAALLLSLSLSHSPIRRLFITNLSARAVASAAVRAKTAADYVQAPNVSKCIILVSTRGGRPESESGIFLKSNSSPVRRRLLFFSPSEPPSVEWD